MPNSLKPSKFHISLIRQDNQTRYVVMKDSEVLATYPTASEAIKEKVRLERLSAVPRVEVDPDVSSPPPNASGRGAP
jgi:hypothetical protein